LTLALISGYHWLGGGMKCLPLGPVVFGRSGGCDSGQTLEILYLDKN
jgi:hypothetical protein